MAGEQVEFTVHDSSFERILGSTPSAKLIAKSDNELPLYHEACIYQPQTRSVFVTSNQLSDDAGVKHVKLTQVFLDDGRTEQCTPRSLTASFLNGGVNYGQDILMCAQGSLGEAPSGLVTVSSSSPDKTSVLLDSFHGIPFNSVNDVAVHAIDGSIWFTDPCYGYHQGIRPKPQLPNQVYCFNPQTKSVRAVADGFTRPNGICFSPDLKTVYITDTGAIHGSSDVPIDQAGPSHIYAFDLIGGSLVNRRLFAYAPGKFPDGIKCDIQGNVYAGCGNGVEVWNKGGVYLGVIQVKGGVANFCFGEKGVLILCNETRLWQITLDAEVVKGALLGI